MADDPARAALVACPKGYEKGSFSECFAPFRYCPEKGCGRGERDDERKPRVAYPATWEERLDKIAEMHSKQVGAGGMTSGDCNECGWAWPCATYRWATELVDVNCSWDLRECSFEEHDHEALGADAAGDYRCQPCVEGRHHACSEPGVCRCTINPDTGEDEGDDAQSTASSDA